MSASILALVVDPIDESREALGALLEHAGIHPVLQSRADFARALLERQRPDVLLLDHESAYPESAARELVSKAAGNGIPTVVFGTQVPYLQGLPGAHVIGKPYHYGPLIGRIKALLAEQQSLTRQSA